jgi:hypothetical protein
MMTFLTFPLVLTRLDHRNDSEGILESSGGVIPRFRYTPRNPVIVGDYDSITPHTTEKVGVMKKDPILE